MTAGILISVIVIIFLIIYLLYKLRIISDSVTAGLIMFVLFASFSIVLVLFVDESETSRKAIAQQTLEGEQDKILEIVKDHYNLENIIMLTEEETGVQGNKAYKLAEGNEVYYVIVSEGEIIFSKMLEESS